MQTFDLLDEDLAWLAKRPREQNIQGIDIFEEDLVWLAESRAGKDEVVRCSIGKFDFNSYSKDIEFYVDPPNVIYAGSEFETREARKDIDAAERRWLVSPAEAAESFVDHSVDHEWIPPNKDHWDTGNNNPVDRASDLDEYERANSGNWFYSDECDEFYG